MKKIIVLVVGLVLMSACGGGGSGMPSIDKVDEGSGPTLDLTKADSAESIVGTVLENLDNASDSSTSSSETSSSGTTSSSMTIKSIAKATDSNNEFYELCSKGQYGTTINKTINGYSGTATFNGSVNANKTNDDQAKITADVDGNFTDFVYYTPAKGKNYKLTGSSHMDGEANITKGLKQICDAMLTSASLGDSANITSDMYEHVSGGFSISGDAGAAITFDFTTTLTTSSDPKSFSSTSNISGTAKFKSGDKTVTCTIGKEDGIDSDTDSFSVKCE